MMTYPFTEQEMETAANEWGANCGPSALAMAIQCPLVTAGDAIPGFRQKGYTSPTMMKQGLANLGASYVVYKAEQSCMFGAQPALVRVQWDGPWCLPGMNPKWAYWQTHWIATWVQNETPIVFDCNGGMMTFARWEAEIVPLILSCVKRSNGKWFPTHIWRIVKLRDALDGKGDGK